MTSKSANSDRGGKQVVGGPRRHTQRCQNSGYLIYICEFITHKSMHFWSSVDNTHIHNNLKIYISRDEEGYITVKQEKKNNFDHQENPSRIVMSLIDF